MVRPYGSPHAFWTGRLRRTELPTRRLGCRGGPFDKPIGFWLKELDRLIDKHFEMQLSDAGLSRRQWQLLNLFANNPRSVPELQAELEPFLQRAEDDLSDALAGLVKRGWAESTDNIVNLTGTGLAHLEIVKAKVAELRQALMAGISPEEYQATIDVIARMAANLESNQE
jgi:DNA-binding MarR family transcriptional regulator